MSQEFEELSAQVPDLADHHLERLFYNGLSLEMKEVIRMKDPQGLQNFIAAVLRKETSAFCKLVGEKKAGSTPVQKSATGTTTRNQGPFIQKCGNQDRSKWAVGDNKQLEENMNHQRSAQRARLKYSDAELDGMRREGVCFKCGDKWSKIHASICPKRELCILTVINGLEMELVDDMDDVEAVEMLAERSELKTLSYNAFMGISSPRTIELWGYMGQKGVTMLLDSGASHNFISPGIVQSLSLSVGAAKGLDVLLGNKVIMKGIRVCQAVEFQINSTTFTSDFIALELSSVDVVLGIQWLETLGKCEVDKKEQEFSFNNGGQRVTLLGDRSLHDTGASLKMVVTEDRIVQVVQEIQCSSLVVLFRLLLCMQWCHRYLTCLKTCLRSLCSYRRFVELSIQFLYYREFLQF